MLQVGQHIHIVGIGGFGMSAIARVLVQQGYTVSGSDLRANDLTRDLERAGVTVCQGHDAAHIAGADVVVTTSAAAGDNPEIVAARAQGIPVLRRRDLLGELMAQRTGIAIAGTHGKTTTTALLAHVLIETGRDPTYIIGGVMLTTGTNAGVGQGPYFVIEADEYDHMFLGLQPRVAAVLNIEHDHPDCFPTLADVIAAFTEFTDRLPEDGLLVVCTDDGAARTLGQRRWLMGRPVVRYSLDDPSAEWFASELTTGAAGEAGFTVTYRGEVLGQARLSLAGRHNVLNALAVIAITHHLGIPFEQIAAALVTFQGTQRRAEIMGQAGGVTVINDYAHHPTAIRVTLDAQRARPGLQRLWAVWQPHTYGRMRTLADDFAGAFGAADVVLVTDVYSVREQVSDGLDAAGMAARIPHARHTGSLEETARVLIEQVRPGDVIVLLSAGDAPHIGELVLAALTHD